MNEQIEPMLVKSHFDDFSQTIQGWGLDFKQLGRGLFHTDLHQINTPEVLITDVFDVLSEAVQRASI